MASNYLFGTIPTPWPVYTISNLIEENLADVQTGPFGTMLHASSYKHVGTPVIAVKHIGDNALEYIDLPRVDDETCERLKRYKLQAGDILLGRKGSVEKRALIKKEEEGWIQGSDCIRIRFFDNSINSMYISYVFGSSQYEDWILRNAQGATMPSLNQEIIGRIPIPLPPLPEQRAIAHILGTLDDKIELNRRMNETLEAMARAIFKSWFVDFDPVRAKAEGRDPGLPKPIADLFPDAFEDSELGEIPKGWSTISLFYTAEYVNGAVFNNSHFCETYIGLPVVKIAELKNGINDQTKYSWRQLDTKQRLDTGDMLYSWSGSPDTSLDVFLWTKGPALLNQHIFKIITKTNIQKRFVYFLLKYLRPYLVEIARNKQTTGLGHVTIRDMKNLFVINPPKSILNYFDKLISPLFDDYFYNTLASSTLAEIRDTLLSKLISGEIRVEDSEKIAGEQYDKK
ncbi:MAG: restriction endonuclease subunit S [bacterium]